MTGAFLGDTIRILIGKLNGSLAGIRPDDLAAVKIRALIERSPSVDRASVDETMILRCANRAGTTIATSRGWPCYSRALAERGPGAPINRLCGFGPNVVGIEAQARQSGDAELITQMASRV